MKQSIKKWFWIKTENNKHHYVYNPYLNNAEYCLGLINTINKTNYRLKDVKHWYEN